MVLFLLFINGFFKENKLIKHGFIKKQKKSRERFFDLSRHMDGYFIYRP